MMMDSNRLLRCAGQILAAVAFTATPAFSQGSKVTTDRQATSTKPFFQKSFLLGAHRGGAGDWPESTMVAFTEAAKRWPNALLETDARMTSDGTVVLCHDGTVDRTTDGTGPIAEKTLAQVKSLDAGYRFTRDGGKTFPYRGKGIRIATLAEVLSAFPHQRFLVELKSQEGIADAVVKVLRESKAEDRVLLASFNAQLMERARALAPQVASCFDFTNGMILLKHMQDGTLDSYTPAADVLSLDKQIMDQFKVTPAMMEAARKKGIYLQLHTLNNEDRMRKALAMGVDSILTDRPDLLAKVIKEWKQKPVAKN